MEKTLHEMPGSSILTATNQFSPMGRYSCLKLGLPMMIISNIDQKLVKKILITLFQNPE